MAVVEGADRVIRALQKRAQEVKPANVTVIYSMPYAAYVHEDLQARHAAGTQAKYLEAPARRYRTTIARLISSVYRLTRDLPRAVRTGAWFLYHESQKLVPVDTGALKASGKVTEGKSLSSDPTQLRLSTTKQGTLDTAVKRRSRFRKI